MPTLYILTVTRKSQLAFGVSSVEIFIDGRFKGRIRNNSQRQFQLTKDEVKLYVKDVSRINIFPFTSQPVNITSEEAKEFDYQIEYGMSDTAYIITLIIAIASLIAGVYYQKVYLLFPILSFLYIMGYKLLNRDKFLCIKKVMKGA